MQTILPLPGDTAPTWQQIFAAIRPKPQMPGRAVVCSLCGSYVRDLIATEGGTTLLALPCQHSIAKTP